MEQEKDLEQREILQGKTKELTEQIKELDKKIKFRNGVFLGLLKGLLSSHCATPNKKEEIKLIQGGRTNEI